MQGLLGRARLLLGCVPMLLLLRPLLLCICCGALLCCCFSGCCGDAPRQPRQLIDALLCCLQTRDALHLVAGARWHDCRGDVIPDALHLVGGMTAQAAIGGASTQVCRRLRVTAAAHPRTPNLLHRTRQQCLCVMCHGRDRRQPYTATGCSLQWGVPPARCGLIWQITNCCSVAAALCCSCHTFMNLNVALDMLPMRSQRHTHHTCPTWISNTTGGRATSRLDDPHPL